MEAVSPKKPRHGMEAAMPGPKPASCNFPDHFLQVAADTVRRRTVSMQAVQRFLLVLLLHEQPSLASEAAARRVGLSVRQVQRWRSRWASGDFSIEDLAGRGRKPAFSPSGSGFGPCNGVRSNRRNRRTAEPAVAWRSRSKVANGVGQNHQP